MKNIFRAPGADERSIQFDGWQINSAFRISLLGSCAYNGVSLAKVAKRADVDF